MEEAEGLIPSLDPVKDCCDKLGHVYREQDFDGEQTLLNLWSYLFDSNVLYFAILANLFGVLWSRVIKWR